MKSSNDIRYELHASAALVLLIAAWPATATAQIAPVRADPAGQLSPTQATGEPAQSAADASPAGDAAAGKDVVVTGSRLASRGYSAPTPVTVVDQQDLRLSGTQNVESLLNNQPQFLGSQQNGPSNITVPGGTTTLNLRGFGAQRNLVLVNGRRFTIAGPDQTTDINTIPAALIKRTEIVTGGSSAVYGSDAITGVVNFILQDNFQGLEFNGQNTVDEHTVTSRYSFDLTAGKNFADGRGNVTASFNYLNRWAYTAQDRGGWAALTLADGCVTADTFSRNRAGTPFAVPSGSNCLAAGGRPGLIVSGSGTIPNGRFSGVPGVGSATSTPGLNAALIAAGLSGLGSRGFTFNDAGTAARPSLTPQDDYNLGPLSYLLVPQKRYLGNAFAHYEFSDAATVYTELNYTHNQVQAQLAPSGVGGNFLFDVNNPYLSPGLQNVLRQLDLAEKGTSTVLEGTSTLTTTAGDGRAILNIGRRLPELGARTALETLESYRGALGVRGKIGSVSPGFLHDLSYDVYATYARSTSSDLENGAVSLSAFQRGLLSQNGAAPLLNIFGQNLSQAALKSIAIQSLNTTEADQEVVAANLSGTLFDMPAGPVDFNAGIEYRREHARFTPDAYLSTGDVSGFNAAKATGGSEQAREIFGEMRVPLLADAPFAKRLSVNGAFRYSNYDLKGVGGVWTYSAGGEYAPTSDITFRGQYQRSIRAPNVGELFGGLVTSGPSLVDPCSSRQPTSGRSDAVRAICVATGVPTASVFGGDVQPNTFVNQVAGGNPNVGPETSDTITVGAVLTPRFARRLQLSVDYFDINLSGAIGPLGGGAANTLNLCYNIIQDASSPFCQAVHRDPISGQIVAPNYVTTVNANTGGIRTSGIDFQGNYSVQTGGGSRLSFGTNVTWTREFTLTPVQALPAAKNYCAGAYGTICGQPTPQWKGATRLTWQRGPLTFSLRHRFIGAVVVDTYLLPKRLGQVTPDYASLTNPRIGMQNYFDLSGSVDVTEKVQFSAGVTNIADRDPPIIGSAAPFNNTFTATYDYEGRTMFIALRARL